jgi:hypothetical protein
MSYDETLSPSFPGPLPAPAAPPRRRGVVPALIVVIALVGVAVVAVALKPKKASSTPLYLEPAASAGIRPFTPSLISPAAAIPPSPTTSSSEPPPTTTSTAAGPTTTAKFPAGGNEPAIHKVKGTTPGLYGGSGDQKVCDPDGIAAFLQQHPDKAAAWVAALNADPTLKWSGGRPLVVADIPQYLSDLRAVVLRYDTRVTNHGFLNGRATPHQSVLQAGTAVLVDSMGVPRVRCACGNPLLPPRHLNRVRWRGTPWPNVCDGGCEEKIASSTPCDVLLVLDPVNGQQVAVPCAPVCLAQPCGTTTLSSETTSSTEATETTVFNTQTTRGRQFQPGPPTTTPYDPPTTHETFPPTTTTFYEPPTTYYEPPTTHYQPPTTEYSPPTTQASSNTTMQQHVCTVDPCPTG